MANGRSSPAAHLVAAGVCPLSTAYPDTADRVARATNEGANALISADQCSRATAESCHTSRSGARAPNPPPRQSCNASGPTSSSCLAVRGASAPGCPALVSAAVRARGCRRSRRAIRQPAVGARPEMRFTAVKRGRADRGIEGCGEVTPDQSHAYAGGGLWKTRRLGEGREN